VHTVVAQTQLFERCWQLWTTLSPDFWSPRNSKACRWVRVSRVLFEIVVLRSHVNVHLHNNLFNAYVLFPFVSLAKLKWVICYYLVMQSGTNGAVTGVGLEVGFNTSDSSTSNEDLVVVSPVSGGPAARAGVVPGDLIMAIDGIPTHGMGLYDAARRLQ
jgi:hypothetical protein